VDLQPLLPLNVLDIHHRIEKYSNIFWLVGIYKESADPKPFKGFLSSLHCTYKAKLEQSKQNLFLEAFKAHIFLSVGDQTNTLPLPKRSQSTCAIKSHLGTRATTTTHHTAKQKRAWRGWLTGGKPSNASLLSHNTETAYCCLLS
jgi:hypothetical protein